MSIMPGRQPYSHLFATHCIDFALDTVKSSLVMGRDPYCGDAYVSIHRGTYGDMPVEIKVWRGSPMNHSTRAEFLNDLAREMERWKRASDHPNVAPFLGLIDGPMWEHLPSLVTPLYSNGNINQYLKKNPKTSILYMLHSIADALAYMHSLDPPVVHGGVRGANVLIADNGDAHLTDLCIHFLPHAEGMAVAGEDLDHARWLAPEILEPPAELLSEHNATTPATDVYAFAMLMFELFSAGKPWPNKRRSCSVICAVVAGQRPSRPTSTSALQQDPADHLWNLIQLCWAQNPDDRPSMRYVQSALHALWLKDLSEMDRFTGHVSHRL